MIIAFCILPIKLCPPQGHKKYSPMFSSESFMVLALSLKSMIWPKNF